MCSSDLPPLLLRLVEFNRLDGVFARVERTGILVSAEACILCLKASYRPPHCDGDYLSHLGDWSRDCHGVHHQKDSRLWVRRADAAAAYCHGAADEVGEGQGDAA